MTRSGQRAFGYVFAAACCVTVSIALLARWWPPVGEGLAALSWPSVPGQIVYASFYSEYNAGASSGMDGEVRDEYTSLSIAYWAPGARGETVPLVTQRFDTASGLWEQPGVFAGNAHEIRHVLEAGLDA